MTNDSILKSGYELAAAQLKVEVLTLAALESNVVLEALEVDVDCVTKLGGSVVNGYYSYVLLLELLDLALDVFILNGLNGLLDLDALVVLDFYLRLGDAGSLHSNACCLIDSGDLNVGSGDQLKTGLLDSVIDFLAVDQVNGFLIEESLAVLLLDQLSGSLALSETGNLNLALVLEVCLLASLLKSLCSDLYLELYLISIDLVC